MATTSKAIKSKRRAPPKAKSKTSGAPLLATSATVRKAKPRTTSAPVLSAPEPAFAMFQVLARVMTAYAELPSRLVQCRSPMDFWREQAQFAQRILDECQSAAPASLQPKARR